MTLLLTISCKEGIIMFADRRIIETTDETKIPVEPKTKIIQFKNYVVGYYGFFYSEFPKKIVNLIEEIRGKIKEIPDIDAAANQIYSILNKHHDKKKLDEVGFHIAGFKKDKGKIRHVFYRLGSNKKKLLINEFCNEQRHKDDGTAVPDKKKFFSLFNGEFTIAGTIEQANKRDYSKISFKEAKEIAKECFSKTIERKKTCGDGVEYIEITNEKIGPISKLDLDADYIGDDNSFPTDEEYLRNFSGDINCGSIA